MTRGWQRLGRCSTSNLTLAIVAPYFARTLYDVWAQRLCSDRPWASFEELKLHQRTLNYRLHDFDDCELGLLFDTPSNGSWAVEGRFEDVYGDGSPLLVEVRIRLFEDEAEA